MSYFIDLSPYTYSGCDEIDQNAVNIGWLEGECEYPTGPVPDGFVERLGWLCDLSVLLTPGVARMHAQPCWVLVSGLPGDVGRPRWSGKC